MSLETVKGWVLKSLQSFLHSNSSDVLHENAQQLHTKPPHNQVYISTQRMYQFPETYGFKGGLCRRLEALMPFRPVSCVA